MITKDVIEKLKSSYPDIPIYLEESTQKFEAPCFYVKLLDSTQNQLISNRYIRKNSYELLYYSINTEECEVVANDLYEKMEFLFDIKAKGRNMHYKIDNKVLHFFVEYKIRLIKECEEMPKLQNMEVNEYGRENNHQEI
ncbi:hypothetical protein SH1V18_16690 [Vallitalea longa]|uniref:Phage protein n=1 Tax=Vallitalea longa TaxID=2936439 RepID=A0A9W5Y9S5_9FIRM|nr:hypothetical protein [Vallitalea longa]GKX29189.1 hypothetical protein SH1V18_16690 [Vallitalea longa]